MEGAVLPDADLDNDDISNDNVNDQDEAYDDADGDDEEDDDDDADANQAEDDNGEDEDEAASFVDDDEEENEDQRVERLQQAIYKRRDDFFVPDHEHLLVTMTKTGEPVTIQTETEVVGYRPKDGNYGTLPLFVSDYDEVLIRALNYYDEDSFDCPVVVWLPDDAGICIINSFNFEWKAVTIISKEFTETFSATFNVCKGVCRGPMISIYLPRHHTVNCDWVLQAISDLQTANETNFSEHSNYNDGDSALYIDGGGTNDSSATCLSNHFSLNAWQGCLETLAAQNVPLVLVVGLALSRRLWTVVQNVERLILDSRIPVPPFVWRACRALKVKYVSLYDYSDDDMRLRGPSCQTLMALSQREVPIPFVCFDIVEIASQWGSDTFETAFLAALSGVERICIKGFAAFFDTWARIWLSPALRQNDTLVHIDLSDTWGNIPAITYEAEGLQHLAVIRENLEANWFLERIEIPARYRHAAAAEYWKANIEPLLELNRSHGPRLEPGEQRLSVLHDALIRVRKHPKKAFQLLVKYPQALLVSVTSQSPAGLQRSHDEQRHGIVAHRETNLARQNDQILELQRQVRAQQRHINELELQREILLRPHDA
jgi:hypothetical protein